MSLAATTTSGFALIDAHDLRLTSSTASPQLTSLPASPIASVWAPDNLTLYVASAHAIHAYSPATGAITKIFTTPSEAPLAPLLLARDTSTLIIVQAAIPRMLSVSASPPKVTFSLPAHAAPVASVALSNDGTLLASASDAGVLHVYNLVHNANTVLRSVARARAVISFDPHVRTRLFVGVGAVLAVYDTTARPAVAAKTVSLAEKRADAGQVVAVSSSPFNKSLVVVACATSVGLADLDKDRPVFKTVPVRAPVTSMSFSADGSTVLLGTETGKVHLLDLRAVERTLRAIDVVPGEKIVALSMQKRTKSSLTVPRIPTSHSAPLSITEVNSVNSPARRVVSSRTPATPTLKPKLTSKSDAAKPKPDPPPKRTFSPPRAPVAGREEDGDISVQLETLIGGAGKKASRTQLAGTGTAAAAATRPSSRLTDKGGRSVSGKGSVAPSDASAGTRASARDATPTPASSHPSPSSLARSQQSKPASSSSLALPRSNASPLSRRTSTASTLRTATPDLPSLPSVDAVDPSLWTRARGLIPPDINPGGLLTTPDLDRWIEAGRGRREKEGGREKEKEKRVGWADNNAHGESDKENAGTDESAIAAKATGRGMGKEDFSPDMSPIRRPYLPSGALQLSPLRGNAAGGNGGAQDLLRAVVKDVMYEYRQETKEDIKGLHLDLLKVGRSWKSELRTIMQEYVGDLRELREENVRLRGENDRLRRGY